MTKADKITMAKMIAGAIVIVSMVCSFPALMRWMYESGKAAAELDWVRGMVCWILNVK